MAKKKDDKYKHSPARLYEFVPDETSITPNNIVELANLVRVGVGGHVLEKLSPELKKHFKEVA
jgi:hypothetical protein